ncbi:hypothetical protein [Patiriisocius sp. Uisw_017]|jgi:predicted flap endonuclease-1-like 5' DNA nuclease|uniref:hypothetical protein n=1 Tax=Patiriisocius sp. Uisw_017 TaxID=3230968 RepID=UPI0039E81A0B
MTRFDQFIELLQTTQFIGILVLMTSTFLIGYFSGTFFEKASKRSLIDRLKKEINSLKIENKKIKNIETILTEIKPQIIQVVKESHQSIEKTVPQEKKKKPENVEAAYLSKSSIANRTRSEYVNYKIEIPSLDFESIGHASINDKNQLTKIDGIGPYIEQKLNEIGIYNFKQISNLEIKDIRVLTTLIDFFPGRIERDDWVKQARSFTLTQ